MKAYLVRLIAANCGKSELVGVFFCNPRELEHFVDECANVDICEYIRLPTGGMYWPGRATAIPVPPYDEEAVQDEGEPFEEPCHTESWDSAFYECESFDGNGWRPVVSWSADEPPLLPAPGK